MSFADNRQEAPLRTAAPAGSRITSQCSNQVCECLVSLLASFGSQPPLVRANNNARRSRIIDFESSPFQSSVSPKRPDAFTLASNPTCVCPEEPKLT